MAGFSEQLVLAQWALSQLGVEDWAQVSKLLRAPEFEGWTDAGGTHFAEQLVLRLPKLGSHGRTVPNDLLRDYDSSIVRHWKYITRNRNQQGPTVYPLYFQYIALLLTEIYLDRYFGDKSALLESLNHFLMSKVSVAPIVPKTVRAAAPKKKATASTLFAEKNLNKLAFWMATGSGKTLLMHCHIRQYLKYSRRSGNRHELNRIILLTPNEGLSRQHLEEFELSGIEADLFDRDIRLFTAAGSDRVDIIDIHKLRETSGEKTVAVDLFESNNLVLVDEGHRGSGGDEWLEKRARLCADGFSFEYSATFGQAIKAASGSRQAELVQTYTKGILFDYSYKFFYQDGYGKDFNILNLAEEQETETRPLYLTACMLAFYQQCRRFADGRAELAPYLLESPLMIFVGGSVTGQRQSQEDTDLVQILKFFADFIGNRAGTVRRLEKLLRRQSGLVHKGEDVFGRAFPFVESLWKPKDAPSLFDDILRYTFNAPGGGQLHVVRLQGSEGEIGLRVGDHPWFGVVNVGDAKRLRDLCEERRGDDKYVVEDLAFADSLFDQIKQPGSGIRILAGAKKFTEGWSSWRVCAMGLMNVGKKEGSEIIQLFGRGVRLKGFRFKLKRTSALDALDFSAEEQPQAHPNHIALLETLNVFGIRSDYMKEFEDYLENEGVSTEDQRESVPLPTIRLPEFERGRLRLNVIRPKAGMPAFRENKRLQLSSLEGRLSSKVLANWYPRLQKQSSVTAKVAASPALHTAPLGPEHLAFLKWDTIWFELERHKREKAYYNILLSPASLRSLMGETWWYELQIPKDYLGFRLDRLPLWHEIVTHLLKGYLDRFYAFEKREFEAPYLEYQLLQPHDDLILREYQLLIRKSERELIRRLRALSEKFSAGEFEGFRFDNLEIFKAARHLYQPLIHLSHGAGQDALLKVVPTHLNEGERQFVEDLETYCKREANGLLEGVELYLLRNHNSDKAISFFSETGFRPDFILWLLKSDSQTIAFLDPKGLRNLTDNFNNPKVTLARRIKDLQRDLKRSDIRLESFLVAQSHRNDLRWPSPANPARDADEADYRAHHILLAKDDPTDYLEVMLADLCR